MNDLGALLEKTIEAYWGQPKTQVYFSNYYGDRFEMRAILFSIILFEINYKFSEYNEMELLVLKDYESKSWDSETTFDENIKVLETLAKHKKLI